ncbi:EVE domain-containing protein [Rathayibacter soli]|uniref:EVE domain-containing protein n=1 Tax=Rathayibacter soli TaxID=3144168 RepID=UPI0027E407F9|nr:EVE domain-containing protein [Glaciibacter superstes]
MAIRYWLSVAPRDRTLREVEAGIVQAYYDARAILAQANESDGIVRYSPRATPDGEVLRQFTAIGWITDAARAWTADAAPDSPADAAPDSPADAAPDQPADAAPARPVSHLLAPFAAPVPVQRPLLRRVEYSTNALAVPIRALLPSLEFTNRNRQWGYQLRNGIIELSKHDFVVIREQMRPPES